MKVAQLVGDGTLVGVYRGSDPRFEVLAVRRPVRAWQPENGRTDPVGPTSVPFQRR